MQLKQAVKYLLMISLLLIGSPVVSAAPEKDGMVPFPTFESQEDILSLLDDMYFVSSSEIIDHGLISSNRACRTSIEREKGYLLGVEQFALFQQIDYCYYTDTQELFDIERDYWYDIAKPLWEFDGYSGDREYGGEGQMTYRAVINAGFSYCLIGEQGCLYEQTLRIDDTVNGHPY